MQMNTCIKNIQQYLTRISISLSTVIISVIILNNIFKEVPNTQPNNPITIRWLHLIIEILGILFNGSNVIFNVVGLNISKSVYIPIAIAYCVNLVSTAVLY